MDKCNSTFLSDGNSYLPSIHEFELELVRTSNCVIFMIDNGGGAISNFIELGDNNLNTLNAAEDDMNIKISDLNFY